MAALRVWRRQPWLAVAAILSLALGIGATAAIFTVLRAVVLRPLPYADPSRLVALWETSADDPSRWIAPANFLDWQRDARSFASMAAYDAFPLALTGMGEAERLSGGGASGTFFSTLGVAAEFGRALQPHDDAPGAPAVAVLTRGLAERLFGGPASAVGTHVTLEGRSHEVVGVLPAAFSMPLVPSVEIWVNGDRGIPRSTPFPTDVTTVRDAHFLYAVGRLRPGVGVAAARQELGAIMARLGTDFPATNAGLGAHVVPLLDEVAGEARALLVYLQLAVLALLGIACANVASLLLGQAVARRQELATQVALGAPTAALVRQWLAETAVLVVPGGLAGLGLAIGGVRLLVAAAPASLPRIDEIRFDGGVLAFTALVTIATAFACGLLPAIAATRRARTAAAHPSARVVGDRGVGRWHELLVVGELATASVLLGGAGLLVASLLAAQDVPTGITTDGRVAATLSLAADRYLRIANGERIDPEPRRQLVARVLEALRGTPGVRRAAAAFTAPLAGAPNRGVRIEGEPEPPPNQEPTADFQAVTADFFATQGIPLLAGRVFDSGDHAAAARVALVNDTFADRYLGGRDPIGREVTVGGDRRHRIVGVVADARYRAIERAAEPMVFVPLEQNDERWPYLALMAWTDGDPAAIGPVIRAAVQAVDPLQPITRIQTYDEILDRSLAPRRFTATIAGAFAGTAALLALVGTYGVLAYAVRTRTREFGVRAALGATPADLSGMVLRQGGRWTAVALVIGAGGGWLASQAMTALLFGVSAGDVRTMGAVAVLLAAGAMGAAWLPARAATAADPMQALRDA